MLSSYQLAAMVEVALSSQSFTPLREAVHRVAVGKSSDEIYDHLALHAARQFIASEMSFAEADQLANQVYSAMLHDRIERGSESELPKLAYSIFSAFDSGEWTRDGETEDDAEQRTLDTLRAILEIGFHPEERANS